MILFQISSSSGHWQFWAVAEKEKDKKKEAWGYLDLVLGEESEALEEEGGEAGEEEDGLVEQEGDDGGELELGEVGDQDLHSFPSPLLRQGRAERDRDLGMRTERRESRAEENRDRLTQRVGDREGEGETGGGVPATRTRWRTWAPPL